MGHLIAEELVLDLDAEALLLKSEETWHRANHNSKTLVKQPDFRIVLVVLKPGGRLAAHTAAGRLSIQVLHGELSIHLPDQVLDLPAGSLLALDRQVLHDVEAREESVFLLTLMWPEKEGTR